MATPSMKQGILFAVIGTVTWGLNGAVTQFLFMHYTVNSAWLTAIRMIVAGPCGTACANCTSLSIYWALR